MEQVFFKDTSTIFQLAFGLNIVGGVWISNFSKARELLWEKFESTISEIAPKAVLESPSLYKALECLFPRFRTMTNYCLVAGCYSIFTVIICFLGLLAVVIIPNETINSYIFIFIATLILIVNPIIYYFFNVYYKYKLSLYLKAVEIYTRDDHEGILLIAEVQDQSQEMKKLDKDIKSTSLKFKLLEFRVLISIEYRKLKARLKQFFI